MKLNTALATKCKNVTKDDVSDNYLICEATLTRLQKHYKTLLNVLKNKHNKNEYFHLIEDIVLMDIKYYSDKYMELKKKCYPNIDVEEFARQELFALKLRLENLNVMRTLFNESLNIFTLAS